jgi:hypothetical protein
MANSAPMLANIAASVARTENSTGTVFRSVLTASGVPNASPALVTSNISSGATELRAATSKFSAARHLNQVESDFGCGRFQDHRFARHERDRAGSRLYRQRLTGARHPQRNQILPGQGQFPVK